MEKFRSMSWREGRIPAENNSNNKSQPANMQDLRSFSTNSNYVQQVHPQPSVKEFKQSYQRSYSKKNRGSGSSASNSSSSKGWSFSDPEIQRKKRVASYKVYAVEGKMKGSLRKSCRWIKHTCSQVVYGWW